MDDAASVQLILVVFDRSAGGGRDWLSAASPVRVKMELGRATDYHIGLKPWISSELVGRPGGSISTFTISALERATGVPRSTIHYYIGEELLPRPAKTAASRSLYTEDHVELLRRITGFKQSGLSLAEIKEELKPDLARTSGTGVDLAAHEYERIHAEMIEAATDEFVTNGYEEHARGDDRQEDRHDSSRLL